MQQVIELGRGIRDQAKRPLKVPLRSLVVVHTDQSFLQEIAGTNLQSIPASNIPRCVHIAAVHAAGEFAHHVIQPVALTHFMVAVGELREYVVEELNVRALETCDQPLQYAQLRAEPDWKVFCSCSCQLNSIICHMQNASAESLLLTLRPTTATSGDRLAAGQDAGQGHERRSGRDPGDGRRADRAVRAREGDHGRRRGVPGGRDQGRAPRCPLGLQPVEGCGDQHFECDCGRKQEVPTNGYGG